MPKFTYEIKKSGFNQVIIVFSDGKSIYNNNSPTSTEADLVRIAKVALRDNYGSGVDQMIKVPSLTSSTPAASSISEKQQNIKQNEEKLNQIKEENQAKIQKAQENFNTQKDLINKDINISSTGVKKKIIALLLPVFLNFIRKESIINTIIESLKKSLKKRLKNNGTLTITGSTFIFTPKDYSKWTNFKDNFDKKVNNVKKLLETLNNIVDKLQTILTILNLSLTALQLVVTLYRAKILARRAKITAELASPSPSKPTVSIDLENIDATKNKLDKTLEKIKEYRLYISIVQPYIIIFKSLITKLTFKINQLQLIIVNSNINSSINLNPILIQQPENNKPETEYISKSTNKSYILKLVVFPNGSAQYQALDSFSKLKITQTAVSKIKTTDQLLEEIKQILG